MKTFRLLRMTAIVVLMGFGFTSCSKEENSNPNGKKVVKITNSTENNSNSQAIEFNYDNKGRLIETVVSQNFNNQTKDYSIQYIWGDDVIETTEGYIYTLSDGLIQSDGGDYYTYDQSGRLVEYGNDSRWWTKVAWNNDKFVKSSDRSSDVHTREITWTYGKSCPKGYFPLIEQLIHLTDDAFFVAHPELAGIRTTQLPASCTIVDYAYGKETGTETVTFTYEFNNDGYISKFTEHNRNETYSCIITWE